MERIRKLDRYQKCALLILAVMFVFFTVTYVVVSSRVGFAYRDVIFQPHNENGKVVYTAQIDGNDASFTVTKDKEVTYSYGDKVYGPYTAREDAAAIPKDEEYAEDMIGVEIREGQEVIFRGGVLIYDKENLDFWLHDENGNAIAYSNDEIRPSEYTILELMGEPKLTSKGEWAAWIGAVILSILIALNVWAFLL